MRDRASLAPAKKSLSSPIMGFNWVEKEIHRLMEKCLTSLVWSSRLRGDQELGIFSLAKKRLKVSLERCLQ
jgi:hypothetical protein